MGMKVNVRRRAFVSLALAAAVLFADPLPERRYGGLRQPASANSTESIAVTPRAAGK